MNKRVNNIYKLTANAISNSINAIDVLDTDLVPRIIVFVEKAENRMVISDNSKGFKTVEGPDYRSLFGKLQQVCSAPVICTIQKNTKHRLYTMQSPESVMKLPIAYSQFYYNKKLFPNSHGTILILNGVYDPHSGHINSDPSREYGTPKIDTLKHSIKEKIPQDFYKYISIAEYNCEKTVSFLPIEE